MQNILGIVCLNLLLFSFSGCVSSQAIANQKSSLTRTFPEPALKKNETVILLHGLNRTSRSMQPMADALSAQGYSVCSVKYPSRYFSVKVLAKKFVLPRIQECVTKDVQAVHYVTHSLGGILARQLDPDFKEFPKGKMVMLSPPNQGSEVVDEYSNTWIFQQMAGPAGNELGTSGESLPQLLPVPSMPFAVIAASHSNSAMSLIIPGDDDGKVALENMQLQGMQDYLVIGSTHSFIMSNADTIHQVIYFLDTGRFERD